MSGYLSQPSPDNEFAVTIVVGGQSIGTWSDVRISRSLRRFSDFELSCTEKFPDDYQYLFAAPFQECTVMIGNTKLLTGYVDQYNASVSKDSHAVTISGRSKCEDIQDCSIDGTIGNTTHNNINLLNFANELCSPYNITARIAKGTPTVYPSLVVPLTMTPKEAIQKVAAYSNMIVYDDETGNLVLSTVGEGSMGSGVYEGFNMQQGSIHLAGDRRFSDYYAVLNAVSSNLQNAGTNNTVGHGTDKGVPRKRIKTFQSNTGVYNTMFAQQMAQWQANHNYGEGFEMTVIVDSWTDISGSLWEPNYYIEIDCPSLRTKDKWIIADVMFMRNTDTGTTAQLTMQPWQAFSPEPVLPVSNNLSRALGGTTPAQSPTPFTKGEGGGQ